MNRHELNESPSFRSTSLFWSAVFHDLGRLLRPVLIPDAVVGLGLGLATVLKLRSSSKRWMSNIRLVDSKLYTTANPELVCLSYANYTFKFPFFFFFFMRLPTHRDIVFESDSYSKAGIRMTIQCSDNTTRSPSASQMRGTRRPVLYCAVASVYHRAEDKFMSKHHGNSDDTY
jgi:hypothetical protein